MSEVRRSQHAANVQEDNVGSIETEVNRKERTYSLQPDVSESNLTDARMQEWIMLYSCL